jgi:hypothetical protein
MGLGFVSFCLVGPAEPAASRYPLAQVRTTAVPFDLVGRALRSARVPQTGQSMFARRLALAIAVLAGLIGSQGPEFAQQYRQRLGGALEELSRIVSEFDAEVRGQNLTRAEGLKRLEDNDDPLAHERGEDMGKAIERAKRLNEQIQAMNSAGPLMRLYVITKGFDPAIARSTLDNYEPAGPLSLGALTSGGLAALWGWAATRLIAWPFSRRSGLRAARA